MTAKAAILPQRVKCGVCSLFPVPQFRIGKTAEGLIRPLMHTDICHAVPAEIDFAVALAVDDLAVDILSLSTAVVTINFAQ